MGDRKKEKKTKKISLSSIVILIFIGIFIVFSIIFILNKDIYNKIAISTGLKSKPASNAEFSVHFIDVAQGDCSLIIIGDKIVLIDTGDAVYSQKVIYYIKAQNINTIDYVILSHPHADHIGGFINIAKAFKIKSVYMRDIPDKNVPEDVDYYNFIKVIKDKNINVCYPEFEEKLSVNNAELIFYTLPVDYDNLNNASIITKINYQNTSFLFTGDIEKKAEKDIIVKNIDLKADVLKVAHHGSNTSSSDEFLERVKPGYCVISCGVNNSFNHPTNNTISRLSKYTSDILRTDLLSDIVFEFDGNKLKYLFRKEWFICYQ